MIKSNDYKFKVSLSKDSYVNKEISDAMIQNATPTNKEIRKKYGFKANKGVGYVEQELTTEELYNALCNGKVMCHLFNTTKFRTDGTFGSYEKKDDNFVGSYVIGVDIDDTKFDSMRSFVESLSLKPTFAYTSYSNGLPNKGVRFRLIYVMDSLVYNKYIFRYVAYKLYEIIERDTNEPIKDKCGLKCSQYFNGTNKNNKDIIFDSVYFGNIYNTSDFGCTDDDFYSFTYNYFYFKSKTSKIKEDRLRILDTITSTNLNPIQDTSVSTTYYNDLQKNEHSENEVEIEDKVDILDSRFVNDMDRLDYDEFMKYNRHKYNYYWRIEGTEWNRETKGDITYRWQHIQEGYFSLYYNASTVKDGGKRRKKLYQRMCLRRIMNPAVDANTILFNAYEDLHRFFENEPTKVKNVISVEELVKNVRWCFDKSIEDLEEEFSETLKYLRSKAPKRGKIYKFTSKISISDRNTLIKDVVWGVIGEFYDTSISVQDNLQVLKDNGILVCEKTLYTFCKENGINTKIYKINSDNEMMEHYDTNLSLRKNLVNLKSIGYKISLGKLSKLVS